MTVSAVAWKVAVAVGIEKAIAVVARLSRVPADVVAVVVVVFSRRRWQKRRWGDAATIIVSPGSLFPKPTRLVLAVGTNLAPTMKTAVAAVVVAATRRRGRWSWDSLTIAAVVLAILVIAALAVLFAVPEL